MTANGSFSDRVRRFCLRTHVCSTAEADLWKKPRAVWSTEILFADAARAGPRPALVAKPDVMSRLSRLLAPSAEDIAIRRAQSVRAAGLSRQLISREPDLALH